MQMGCCHRVVSHTNGVLSSGGITYKWGVVIGWYHMQMGCCHRVVSHTNGVLSSGGITCKWGVVIGIIDNSGFFRKKENIIYVDIKCKLPNDRTVLHLE